MDLLRHWRRGTFGMAASALMVPGAILLAALTVGIGGGGIAGLGALSQALEGPDLPRTSAAAQQRRSREPGRLLARVNRRAAARARPAAATPRTAPTQRSTGGGTGPIATTNQPQGTTTPSGGQTPPAAPAPTAPPATTPAPAPTSVVHQVGDTVTTVTDQVPVVGPTTHQVVDTVVDTVDAIIPPR